MTSSPSLLSVLEASRQIMAYQDLAPANITGPCITSYCLGSTLLPTNKYCTTQINQCTANSRNYTHFFNSSNSEQCSYNANVAIAAEFVFCYLQELSGSIQGSGSSWSIFDAVSTVPISFQDMGTTATEAALTIETGKESIFSHFFTETQVTLTTSTNSEATSAVVTTPASTTQSSASCSSGYLCGSLLAGMSITSGTLAPTTTPAESLLSAAEQSSRAASNLNTLNTKNLLVLAICSISLFASI